MSTSAATAELVTARTVCGYCIATEVVVVAHVAVVAVGMLWTVWLSLPKLLTWMMLSFWYFNRPLRRVAGYVNAAGYAVNAMMDVVAAVGAM